MNRTSKYISSSIGAGRIRRHRLSGAHSQAGFTLLELILALGLTVMVVGLVGAAVYTTINLVDKGREKTERDQLGRAILNRIATDIRSTIRYQQFDPTGMMSVKSSGKSSSAAGGGGTSGSGTGASGTGTSSGGTSGSKSGSTSSTGSSGSTGGSSGSSGSSSASSSPSDSGSDVVTPSYPGVTGDGFGMIIDIGRIPRYDEYGASGDNSTGMMGAATDVRTVGYYVAGPSAPQSMVVTTAGSTSASGLVRREHDRAVSQYSSVQGDGTDVDTGAVFAPEVTNLEFEYYDGTEWLTEWDTTANGGLPQAVKISIVLQKPARGSEEPITYSSVEDALTQDPDSVYSMIVRIPAADPIDLSEQGGAQSTSSGTGASTSASGGSSTGTGGTGSTGGTGGSGATGS